MEITSKELIRQLDQSKEADNFIQTEINITNADMLMLLIDVQARGVKVDPYLLDQVKEDANLYPDSLIKQPAIWQDDTGLKFEW